MSATGLLITSRLGVRFRNRPLATRDDLDRRIEILRRTSLRTLNELAAIQPAWIIQTDESHVEYLRSVFSDPSRMPLERGIVPQVVGRAGSRLVASDLAALRLPWARFLCLRLDSDDHYLSRELLASTKHWTNLPVGTVVEFPRGYLIDIRSNDVIRHSYLEIVGPFYGILTNPDNPIAAIGDHTVATAGRDRVLVTRRTWVQTVHGGNFLTTLKRQTAIGLLQRVRRRFIRGFARRPMACLAMSPLDLMRPSAATLERVRQAVKEI
jgi:hypothetical protein